MNEERKRILVIGPLPPPYAGVEIMTDVLLRGLKHTGHFSILHLNTHDPRGSANKGRLDFYNIYYAFMHFFQLAIILLREDPCIVYLPISQNTLGFIRDSMLIILSAAFNKKVVVHLHGAYFHKFYRQSYWQLKVFIKYVFKYIRAGIVLGKDLKNIFNGLLPSNCVFVVNNGIPDVMKEYRDNKFLRIRRNRIKKQILFVGIMKKSKGYMDLLKAAPIILNKRKDVKFVFAGEWYPDGGREESYKFIEAHKIGKYVHFPGIITGYKKSDLYRNSDIFVFPSYFRFEGQPLVIIEAMAVGLPIITTPIGVIRDCVQEGVNGYFISHNNPNEVAEKTIKLLEQPVLMRKLGRNSRRIFVKHFTSSIFIKGMEEVINIIGSD